MATPVTCPVPEPNLRQRLKFVRCRLTKAAHHAEHPLHLLYLGLVSYESHHFYAYAAGGLALVTLLELIRD